MCVSFCCSYVPDSFTFKTFREDRSISQHKKPHCLLAPRQIQKKQAFTACYFHSALVAPGECAIGRTLPGAPLRSIPATSCSHSKSKNALQRAMVPLLTGQRKDSKAKAPSREHSTGYASTPRRPFPPLDTPHPRHPPQQVTPKGGKGTLGGSCCCWPTLHWFISFW